MTKPTPRECMCDKDSTEFTRLGIWIGYEDDPRKRFGTFEPWEEIVRRKIQSRQSKDPHSILETCGPATHKSKDSVINRYCALCGRRHVLVRRKITQGEYVWTYRFRDPASQQKKLFCITGDGRKNYRFWRSQNSYHETMSFLKGEELTHPHGSHRKASVRQQETRAAPSRAQDPPIAAGSFTEQEQASPDPNRSRRIPRSTARPITYKEAAVDTEDYDEPGSGVQDDDRCTTIGFSPERNAHDAFHPADGDGTPNATSSVSVIGAGGSPLRAQQGDVNDNKFSTSHVPHFRRKRARPEEHGKAAKRIRKEGSRLPTESDDDDSECGTVEGVSAVYKMQRELSEELGDPAPNQSATPELDLSVPPDGTNGLPYPPPNTTENHPLCATQPEHLSQERAISTADGADVPATLTSEAPATRNIETKPDPIVTEQLPTSRTSVPANDLPSLQKDEEIQQPVQFNKLEVDVEIRKDEELEMATVESLESHETVKTLFDKLTFHLVPSKVACRIMIRFVIEKGPPIGLRAQSGEGVVARLHHRLGAEGDRMVKVGVTYC